MRDKELENLIDKIKIYAPNADFQMVETAFVLAKNAHEGQERRSGEPYIIHPIAVANILADMQLDIETIVSGLLHDVVEDTEYTYDDIKEEFGEDVAELVDGVTKLGQIKYQSKEATQSENLRKMFLAMAKDIRVILIKLADRLHNMRTLKYMPPEKAKYKAQETVEIYGGIAHRLGISKIKWELEDLALRYIDPEGYYDLVDKVSMKRDQREAYIEKIVQELRVTFKEMDIECDVYGRPKHFYSIYKKMEKKHKSFDEIFDLTAVRVLVNSVKDCYAVLGVVHTLWKPMPGRFKDYIAMPKPNMYQSLHTTVVGPDGEPLEIQIRTFDMHNIAENGIAAHWKYKEGITDTKQLRSQEKLQWLKQMMEWEKDVKDPEEFMDALKEDVFNYQVYVFTPQGDVVELPNDSTPIDFAYRVHTKVGNHCVGAKIDGKIVPLDYKLKNGNIVEILTSPNSNGPSRDWLAIVKTPTARNRIRQYFKKERREENVERGNEILEAHLKRNGLPTRNAQMDKYLAAVAKKHNQPSVDDLVATVGYGGILGSQVITKVKEMYLKDVKKDKAVQEPEVDQFKKHQLTDQEFSQKRKKGSSQGVTVKGVDNILIRFAKCCNPLPGDDIVGYITKGRGVAVHRTDCPNVALTEDNGEFITNRLVEVEWTEVEHGRFEAELQLKAVDRKGVVNDVTHVLSIEKISLNGINARKSKDTVININLLVEVEDTPQLKLLIKKLKAVPGVEDAYRMKN
ncbi:MAG: bifunctional (p)ppGpp synthetase/guanosine-3',5'-bis(diphosphate) 3'-pyrophosphohydrolase [Clostridioides sp.]|nr:bifunctional (p)ppGpp synthetase/guanosine-3',5'-bis(diphosphate) 3'-pyrophosphohydrolase [Clostridioides sp.]